MLKLPANMGGGFKKSVMASLLGRPIMGTGLEGQYDLADVDVANVNSKLLFGMPVDGAALEPELQKRM